MKICEIEFASSSIACSKQIINELELNLFSLEFNYLRTTSLELNSIKRVRVKLNFSQIMCTISTRKTQMFIIPPTMSDRVGDDGVGVSGPGGRGDHGSSTNAS